MSTLLTAPAFDHQKVAELLHAFPPLETYAPPRLVPLCLVARSLPPLADDDVAETAAPLPRSGEVIHGRHSAAINAPSHILTGSLRRGWSASVAAMVMQAERDAEERLVQARSETWKRARHIRPAAISAEAWDSHIAEAMRMRVEPVEIVQLLAGIALHVLGRIEWPPGLEELIPEHGRGACWEAFLAASEGWDAAPADEAAE